MNARHNFFSLFGIPPHFGVDLAELKARFYQLQKKMHPDNFVNASPQEKRLAVEYCAQINEAYRVLNDPLKRATYLLALEGCEVDPEADTSMPLEFLAEQMRLREQLMEADNPEILLELEEEVALQFHQLEKQFIAAFEQKNYEAARLVVRKMHFYHRLQQEVFERA